VPPTPPKFQDGALGGRWNFWGLTGTRESMEHSEGLVTGRSRLASLRLDQVAIAMSGLCVVHCLAGPLLVVLAPAVLISFGVSDALFHRLLLLVVVPSSAVGLGLGCRRHRDRAVIGLGLLGLAALCLAAIAGHDLLGEAGERALTLAGAVVIATAHLRNFRLCRRSACHAPPRVAD
jgi:MerC mercury resistance protein